MQSTCDEKLIEEDQQVLLDIAEQSILFGLESGRLVELKVAAYAGDLRRIRSSFVTLRICDQLRGCVGAVEGSVPLAVDVSRHAFGAAFYDVRFPAARAYEFPWLKIHISVLSPLKQLPTGTLAETLSHIRPGIHGVVLCRGERMATFLPDVWATLQEPVEFLRHLRLKAGLDPDTWSSDIEVSTYTTQRLSRQRPHPLQSMSAP